MRFLDTWVFLSAQKMDYNSSQIEEEKKARKASSALKP